ncbi:MAG: YbgC/FadM family acyl-CoA thioesterase [Proteobacteria bacterium]|nr:YbgC/FadM family acyl-CoA thioesterase [Pseudomonadota bacterium]MBU1388095.1 YbgC/FadM family acyl-CoA thioesterase [Pseudomonadota bacterium]MBU1542159.1 YbgC/FadM family acyl-CoA thioesterase [Pseudomonadota bacterium]MBU2430537.1 YbgC/FadM family acyl-CoA thioesterase [Pseudomonadota bacterium]MBU2481685.1 YbgC/FadM family acyl-CoA thioesterase [Pseudomonadota bacterium]
MTDKHTHLFSARVYYEDTDHSGVVYHSNYLKFFERAREDIIGVTQLAKMWHDHGIGFAVYKASINYHDGAVFGDLLEIKTTWEKQGDYRVVFFHEAWRPGARKPAVTCQLELVCLGPNKKLMQIPDLDFLG